jgi:hypothetical protein
MSKLDLYHQGIASNVPPSGISGCNTQAFAGLSDDPNEPLGLNLSPLPPTVTPSEDLNSGKIKSQIPTEKDCIGNRVMAMTAQ